jgi:hypothetical protein
MHRTQHRLLTILATACAALTFGAAPALAGSSGCAGGDCQDENAPAQIVPGVPTQIVPGAPAPAAPAPSSAGNAAPRTVTVGQASVPTGSVAAGAGGMAPQTPKGVVAALGGSALLLIAMGVGLLAFTRPGRA